MGGAERLGGCDPEEEHAMSDLIERYLAAVERALPERQRADIVAELRDELLSATEAREAELGRALTREELDALLLARGNPLVVAGRFRRVQHLVGPDVFPLWWAVLKVVLGIVAAVYVVALVVAIMFQGGKGDVTAPLPGVFTALMTAFGSVTLAAVAIERLGWARLLYRWKPSDLPPPKATSRSTFEIVTEIGMEVVFLLWWFGVIQFRNLIPWGELELKLADTWAPFFWPVVGYSLVELAINLFALARPGWAGVHAGLSVGRGVLGVAILVPLLQAGHWVSVSSAKLAPARVLEVQAGVDLVVKVSLAVTLGVVLVKLAMSALAAWRAMRSGSASPSPA
jgi:hypothetical protein